MLVAFDSSRLSSSNNTSVVISSCSQKTATMQRVLVLNSGSSSLKLKLFDVSHASRGHTFMEAISGLVERIGNVRVLGLERY